jgi:hypothetical protein
VASGVAEEAYGQLRAQGTYCNQEVNNEPWVSFDEALLGLLAVLPVTRTETKSANGSAGLTSSFNQVPASHPQPEG